jgi:predicted enzyme related to lactoylglutathione lyase
MEVDAYPNGVPSWVDLGTSDLPKARAFYSDLFGWSIEEGPPEAGGYSIAELRGRPVAGLGPQQNPGPPYWTVYMNVDSADATATAITDNGGQVFMPPFDVMDVGRMAIAADPTGAAFGLWEPKQHKGAGIVNEPNTFSWAELVTDGVEAAKPFYASVFGWTAETYGEGAGAYTEAKLGDRSVAGIMARPPTYPAEAPNSWGVYFTVTDTDEAAARINELGGSTFVPPMDIEPGRFAVVRDPAGAFFHVITMKEPRG